MDQTPAATFDTRVTEAKTRALTNINRPKNTKRAYDHKQKEYAVCGAPSFSPSPLLILSVG